MRGGVKDSRRRRKAVKDLTKILAVTNQKGGVGKTTTAVNLSMGLAKLGHRTLLVDFDPQGNATSGCGVDKRGLETSVYDAILNGVPAAEIRRETPFGPDLLPANINLAGSEVELAGAEAREHRLRQALEPIREDYEYILIDCPPSLGLLNLNALTAASGVLIPIQCEFYALEGVSEIMDTIRLVQDGLNPGLVLEGVLLTMYDVRTKLSEQVASEVREYFPEQVYKTVIPRTVRLSEAPSFGMPIIAYDPGAKGAKVYMELAREVADRE